VDLRGVDLNLLLALDVLLSERNVTRAASRMSVGQSGMSATLGRLRKHFGDPLLVREGHTFKLTPLAEALQPLAGDAVSAARAVLGKPWEFDPLVDRRSFTVVASDYTTLVLLRPLIARLADEAPLQRVNVISAQTDFVEHLRTGSADVLIVPTELVPTATTFSHRPLFDDRFVLVADKDNDLGDVVSAEQFAQVFSRLPYIAFSGGMHASIPDSALDALDVGRRVEMTTEGYAIMPFMVAGTKLIALVPSRLLKRLGALDHLAVVEPPVPLSPLRETLVWLTRHTDDPGHRWFREQLAEQAARLEH
jgi:DNA-binding transcriptional LysR family regulator